MIAPYPYLLKIPKKVLSLLESSGVFSTGASAFVAIGALAGVVESGGVCTAVPDDVEAMV